MARKEQAIGVEEDKPKSSVKSVVIGIILSIVIGGGSGFGMGFFFGPQTGAPVDTSDPANASETQEVQKPAGEPEQHPVEDAHSGATEATGGEHGASEGGPSIVALDPIVTNLSDPGNIWIRLELALLSDTPLTPEMSNQIHEDLLAYVRSMRLSEMAGPSAFIDLKAELLARARMRTDNQITKLYVKTLLYE